MSESAVHQFVEPVTEPPPFPTNSSGAAEGTGESSHDTESLARLGQQTLNVAHEIKNPLAGIMASAELLKKRLGEQQDHVRFVDIIVDESERLSRIVRDLLFFGRPASLNRSLTDVCQVAACIRSSLEHHARARGVILGIECHFPEPAAWVDAGRIKQVLANLVLNAIEATPSGGAVTIRVAQDDDSGETTIDVADSGEGIDEEVLPHVFDLFYTTKPDGTGLGLAIARKIVEQHGGRLEIFNGAGSGAVARIRLPQIHTRGTRVEHVLEAASLMGATDAG